MELGNRTRDLGEQREEQEPKVYFNKRELILSGDNTYSSGTTINGGSLVMESGNKYSETPAKTGDESRRIIYIIAGMAVILYMVNGKLRVRKANR